MATFVKADIFETDFSKATVITLFLLPDLNLKLRPTLLKMKPGTRIVSNSFTMGEWEHDQTATVADACTSWCTARFWMVPAQGGRPLDGGHPDADADAGRSRWCRGRSAPRPRPGKVNGEEVTLHGRRPHLQGHD